MLVGIVTLTVMSIFTALAWLVLPPQRVELLELGCSTRCEGLRGWASLALVRGLPGLRDLRLPGGSQGGAHTATCEKH